MIPPGRDFLNAVPALIATGLQGMVKLRENAKVEAFWKPRKGDEGLVHGEGAQDTGHGAGEAK